MDPIDEMINKHVNAALDDPEIMIRAGEVVDRVLKSHPELFKPEEIPARDIRDLSKDELKTILQKPEYER